MQSREFSRKIRRLTIDHDCFFFRVDVNNIISIQSFCNLDRFFSDRDGKLVCSAC
nr:MAG TPA: hypothetical protein [Caudoviricetes sp.]